MANGEFLPLGRALDRAIPRAIRDAERRLIPTITSNPDRLRAAVIDVMSAAYLLGRQAGWLVHATALKGPATISTTEARAWRDSAVEHGETIAARFDRVLEHEPTVQQLTRSALTATETSVWSGQDESADQLAALMDAAWKTWVRAWPRRTHRDWHDALEGVTIPEDHLFVLPGGPSAGARVYGPRDWDAVNDPGEHMNCGHALRYQRTATVEDVQDVIYDPPTASAAYEGVVRVPPVARPRPTLPRASRAAEANAATQQHLRAWVNGAHSRRSVALKEAAQAALGVPGVVHQRRPFAYSPTERQAAQVAVTNLYNSTQATLRREGLRTVTLYRGVKHEYSTVGVMESWTTDVNTARKFAGRNGMIITEEIPVERVLAYRGGPNWADGRYGNQEEWIILAAAPRRRK